VTAAKDTNSPQASEALAGLCALYWYPLYAYVRRRGHAPEDAQDLTQEFFARLLEKDGLRGVDRNKGKFRTFLLTCCQNFLANSQQHARAAKRGGGRPLISIGLEDAERRYGREPLDGLSPSALFERRWALTVVDEARELMKAEYQGTGREALFHGFLAGMTNEPDAPAYGDLARELALTESAIKKAAQRFRGRFAYHLRRQIAATVDGPDQVEEELHALMNILGS
jgi:RNA polymerase sigma-70 factor (ECF subfamily)